MTACGPTLPCRPPDRHGSHLDMSCRILSHGPPFSSRSHSERSASPNAASPQLHEHLVFIGLGSPLPWGIPQLLSFVALTPAGRTDPIYVGIIVLWRNWRLEFPAHCSSLAP